MQRQGGGGRPEYGAQPNGGGGVERRRPTSIVGRRLPTVRTVQIAPLLMTAQLEPGSRPWALERWGGTTGWPAACAAYFQAYYRRQESTGCPPADASGARASAAPCLRCFGADRTGRWTHSYLLSSTIAPTKLGVGCGAFAVCTCTAACSGPSSRAVGTLWAIDTIDRALQRPHASPVLVPSRHNPSQATRSAASIGDLLETST